MQDSKKRFEQAVKSFLAGDYGLAKKNSLSILESEKNPAAHILLGNIYSKEEDYRKAAENFKQAIILAPDSAEPYNNMAILYRKIGKFAKAAEALKKAMLLDPNRADIYYNSGNLAKAMGNIVMAIKAYEDTIKLNPQYIPAYNNLGTIYESQEEYEKAIKIYTEGLNEDPGNASLRYNLGVVYQKKNDWESAQAEFESSLKSRPGWDLCLNNLAVSLQKTGNQEEAKNVLKNIIVKDPENPAALNNMGVVLSELGEIEKAQTFYRKALEKKPDYKQASLNLQDLYESADSHSDSLKLLNKLATTYPYDLEIRNRIAKTLINLKEYKQAESALQQVMQRDPENRESLKLLIELFIYNKDIDRAKKIENKVGHQHLFSSAETVERIVNAFLTMENEDRAIVLLEQYLQYNPDHWPSKKLLSQLYQKNSINSKAIDSILEISEQEPDNLENLVTLADLYNKEDRKEEALGVLDALMTQQSQRGTAEDIDSLRESLEIYEQTAAAIQNENQRLWDKNITLLKKRTQRSMSPPKSSVPESVMLHPESFAARSLVEEDAITLLDINAMDPILEINELEESIYLDEELEDFDDLYTEILEEDRKMHEEFIRSNPSANGSQGFPGMNAGNSPGIPSGQTTQQPQQPIQQQMPQYIPIPTYVPSPGQKIEIPSMTQNIDSFTANQIPPEGEPSLQKMVIEELPPQEVEMNAELNMQGDLSITEVPTEEPDIDDENDDEEDELTLDWEDEELPDESEFDDDDELTEDESELDDDLTNDDSDIEPDKKIPEDETTSNDSMSDESTPSDGPLLPRQEGEHYHTELNKNSMIEMLKYLGTLTDELPSDKKKEVIEKDLPLKLECVTSKLEGERSLMEHADIYDRRKRERSNIEINSNKLGDAMTFFRNLTDGYPDKKVSDTFNKKMNRILERMQEIKRLQE